MVEHRASNNVSANPVFILSVSLYVSWMETFLDIIVKHNWANLN